MKKNYVEPRVQVERFQAYTFEAQTRTPNNNIKL